MVAHIQNRVRRARRVVVGGEAVHERHEVQVEVDLPGVHKFRQLGVELTVYAAAARADEVHVDADRRHVLHGLAVAVLRDEDAAFVVGVRGA